MGIKKTLILALLSMLLSVSLWANTEVNVYNWANYLPPKVLHLFEKQTGIHVNYSTFDSNHILYTKLKADPHAGYDVVFPSSFMIHRMVSQKMLASLDTQHLPDLSNINPRLLKASNPAGHFYCIPYAWGTNGILVNDEYYDPTSITRWSDLWQPRFKNQLLMSDSTQDVFSVVLASMGYSINDTNPEHIHAAYEKLRALLPNIKLFTADASIPTYIDGEATVGMIESGNALAALRANPHLHYIYPKDGATLWIDCMAIPANAPHLKNAYAFINFILQPKIAKMISVSLGYSSPNLAAIQLMSPAMRRNRILNPLPSDLDHAQMQEEVPEAVDQLYLHYFELLKLEGGA